MQWPTAPTQFFFSMPMSGHFSLSPVHNIEGTSIPFPEQVTNCQEKQEQTLFKDLRRKKVAYNLLEDWIW